MKARPILFSGPMVRALLDDIKTQTRRILKPEGAVELVQMIGADNMPTGEWGWCPHPRYIQKYIRCPYGQVGDRLWVRESWAPHPQSPETIFYRATVEADKGFPVWGGPWKPSIHMPRWASRIELEITGIRIERLQDISGPDALAEGVGLPVGTLLFHGVVTDQWNQRTYAVLWEQINGKGSWATNPWVWVVEFKRVTGGAA